MLNPRRIVVFWLWLVCVLGARSVYASCYRFEIERAFRESSAVFVGRVLELAVVRRGAGVGDVETVATFQVTRSWKGSEPTTRVTTCGGGDVVCTVGIEFVVGHEYLVFAYGDTLTTTVCDTAEVAASSTTLKWLQKKPSRKLATAPKRGQRAAGQ